jgi:hypothetical protein
MRQLLWLVSMFALVMTAMPVSKASAGLPSQSAARGTRQNPAEIAAIEAYCKGVDQYLKSHPQATRFFVDALPEAQAASSPEGGKAWYEVKTEDEMLDAERAYAHRSVTVTMKDGEIVHAEMAEPMEHSRTSYGYYFRSDGTLAKIASEFYGNIAEAHIVRDNFYDPSGKLLRAMSQCFHIITTSRGSKERRVSCRRDEMSAEYGNYEIPIYKKSTNLPGYELLKKR